MALSTVRDTTVDLEFIVERNPAFIEEAFSSKEITEYNLKNANKKLITTFWTMKEAHLKRMRIGLKTDLHRVNITNYHDINSRYSTSIVVSPQGKSRCKSQIGSDFVVTISSKMEKDQTNDKIE